MSVLAPNTNRALSFRRPSRPGSSLITEAISLLTNAEDIEARGAIFTRREVVNFILDLVGYTPSQPLHLMKLLEPSFGNGDFLLPAIERLVTAWLKASQGKGDPLAALSDSLRGVELHTETFLDTKRRVIRLLKDKGLTPRTAGKLADQWLMQGDFLLSPDDRSYDFVVGNPPYVRQELIPDVLLAEYRARYSTIYDRADLYIPFLERALTSLSDRGQLGFICADRWMKNRYGGPLRRLVSDHFHLKIYVDMFDTQAFYSDVIAYPAITIITREKPGPTRIAHRPNVDRKTLVQLSKELRASNVSQRTGSVREIKGVTAGAEPWILESLDQLAIVRRLEATFPAIEDAGCTVGIGVATGADRIFIGAFDNLDVEPDRKLPLVMTRDILTGTVQWRGLGIINPFADGGGLVKLTEYPLLHRYLAKHKSQITKRHVAKKAPANWYRTIDRIYPALVRTPKLLIPDIKGEAHVVYEGGHLYPHHNLYYITSDTWDLKALQAVLMSGIAKLFVSIYSTKMRGGYLRFQAQYLRRIRLPLWSKVPDKIKNELITAADRHDVGSCNRAVFRLYGLTTDERAALGGNGE